MYKLSHFQEEDPDKVIDFMHANSFAIITGIGTEYPVATQIPLAIEVTETGIILKGHLMKNTDHHKAFAKNEKVLVVFTGPHCYVSASWYNDAQTASTWNYMTVQAKGKIIFTDDAGTHKAIESVTNQYEGTESTAAFKNIPEEYTNRLLKAIIGFTIEVENLDNVFKLSQNKTADEQKRIINQLQHQGDYNAVSIAEEMKSRLA